MEVWPLSFNCMLIKYVSALIFVCVVVKFNILQIFSRMLYNVSKRVLMCLRSYEKKMLELYIFFQKQTYIIRNVSLRLIISEDYNIYFFIGISGSAVKTTTTADYLKPVILYFLHKNFESISLICACYIFQKLINIKMHAIHSIL